ncbi:MAG: TraX family protein [Lachnospiraceae bacterium]|nr:TraX family protein [Lachnospiraceae bacterium]
MSNNRNDILKVIGIVSMTFDHIGMMLFPHIFWFRIIGRIAFPIFAYHIAIGVKHTKSIAKYALRVFIFACLTQPIYKLAVGNGLNIMFDLFIGIVVLGLIRQNKKEYLALAGLVAFAWPMCNQGYGWYGTGCMIAFYYMDEDVKMASIVFIALSTVAAFYSPYYVQGFAIFALPFILLKTNISIKVPKYLFYVYYPVHLLAIHFVGIKIF